MLYFVSLIAAAQLLPTPPAPDSVAAALHEIAEAIAKSAVPADASVPRFFRDWKDYIVVFVGIPVSIFLAWLGVRWGRKDSERQLDEEQRAILRALSGELSATLYSLFYLSENVAHDEVQGRYAVTANAAYQGFFQTWTIYSSNAGRVHRLTARAFGMLSTYYVKCGETARKFQAELGRGSVSAEVRNLLFEEAGHGALIRIALEQFQVGNLDIQLTAISEQDFEASLRNWREVERKFFMEGRAIWIMRWRENVA